MNTVNVPQEHVDSIMGYFQELPAEPLAPICVDGRDGSFNKEISSEVFPHALGGSIQAAVISYLNNPQGSYSDHLLRTYNRLENAGLPVGVHRGSHRSSEASDCGFADNLGTILSRVADRNEEIETLLNSSAPGIIDSTNRQTWKAVVDGAGAAAKAIDATGEQMVAMAEEIGAQVQTLDGDHAEEVAIVNLVPDTTLNTHKLVADSHQAFNIDQWYVRRQGEALNIDPTFTTLASVALYAATEMVLVEDKKEVRLPILVRQ